MQKKAEEKKKAVVVAKAALVFGAGTLSSRILGLIRDALIYSVLPLDTKDAWIAAFRLPNFFRRLLGEGGLAVSFIPQFIESRQKESPEAQKALISGVFSLLMSIVGLICLICFLFMDSIVSTWLGGAGFTKVPGKIDITIEMARIMLGFLFFITLFAYFMALLNGLKKFALSGFAPMGLNLSIILGLYFFKDSTNIHIVAAWAVLIGGALQAFILLPSVWKSGVLPYFSFKGIFHPRVVRVVQKFIPNILGVGVLQVLTIINTYFASQLESGAVSYIYLADRLLELPLSLIAVSLGTTLLPTLSEYWSQKNKDLFINCVERHFKIFYFLALPASVGLWVLGSDILEVLFVRGQFTIDEVPTVAGVLKVYCLTLLASGALRIFNQSFYASQDTTTPAVLACIGLVLHIIMAPFLMNKWGIQGLVLSTSLTSLFNLLITMVLIQKRVGALDWLPMSLHFMKCMIASAVLGGYLYSLQFMVWKKGSFLFDFAALIVFIIVGVTLYMLTAQIFKIDEVRQITGRFKKRKLQKI